MKAKIGASKKLISRYCLFVSLDRTSLIINTLNCFILFGILKVILGDSVSLLNVEDAFSIFSGFIDFPVILLNPYGSSSDFYEVFY